MCNPLLYIQKYLLISLILCAQLDLAVAQQTRRDSITKQFSVPVAPGPSSPKLNEIPANYEQLIQGLRDAGMSETQIRETLKRLPQSVTTPNEGNQTTPVQNRPTPSLQEVDSARTSPTVEGKGAEDKEREKANEEKKEEMDTQAIEQRIVDSLYMLQDRIYGHHVFEELTGSFNRNQSVVPADDYIIGPGDQLIVSIWGASELQESLIVDQNGAVFRNRIGKTYLGGYTYGTVKRMLRSRYQKIVESNSNIEIILGQNRRTISVNIVGEVNEAGTYNIYANNTVYNTLFESKGVSDIGTVRNIQIRRGGRTVHVFDMYRFWIEAEEKSFFVDNNDMVFVPVQGKIVKIIGSVKRPMRYELKEDEHLAALLKFAGGLSTGARLSHIQIRRIENGREIYNDVNLAELIEKGEDYLLQDGDEVSIQQQRREEYNFVQIEGGVNYPDLYELSPGQRMMDLITRAGGLDTNAYLKRAYVTRITKPGEIEYIDINLERALAGDTTQNIKLQFFDHVLVFLETDFEEEKYIHVIGEVRQPDSFLVSPSMSLKDVLLLARGLREYADLNNIELSTFAQRPPNSEDSLSDKELKEIETSDDHATDLLKSDVLIRRVAITADWEDDPSLDTMMIAAYNQVKVYSKYDFTHLRYIEVEGAVKKPGKYAIQRGMSLKDILYQVGGLTEDADVKEVELYKDIDIKEKGFFSTSTKEKEIHRIELEGDWQMSRVADSIQIYDYYRLVIRSELDFVQQGYAEIKGLVNRPGSYAVSPNMNMLDLLYMAQGLKLEADFEQIELSRVIEVPDEYGKVIPVPMTINKVSTTQDWQRDSSLIGIKIRPFDQVFVRKNPDFELPESVFIEGEVRIPGEYAKRSRSEITERLSTLVGRAGGITSLAYLEGAYLKRPGIGPITIKLDKALMKPGSKHDRALLASDTLIIPPRLDVVTIIGNVLQPSTTISYEPQNRRFKYYVNLAGGFDRRTKKKLSTVAYMDGRVKRAKTILGFRKYPKVEQGAVIFVARRPDKSQGDGSNKPKFSLQEILGTATALLTFYLLIDRSLN